MNTRLLAGEQKTPYGELDSMSAVVTDIKPVDIPLAKGIDIEELKKQDSDPLEVVVEIPVGKSKRNWNYTSKSLKDIVEYTNEHTLNGFLGHQKAEDVASEFKPPVTHWVGAEMRGNSAYFRGLIDADASSLKRWIRTKRIKEVSIFGYPELESNSSTGEIDVVGYDPLSIDWTPLHRPGMPTKIVGMEMDQGKEGKEGDEDNMDFDEIMSKLKDMIKKDETLKAKVAKSLSIKTEKEEGDEKKKENKEEKTTSKEMQEIKTALNISGEMSDQDIVQKVKSLLNKESQAELDTRVDGAIKEKVQGEMAQDLVKKLINVEPGATDETIAGEITKVLEDKTIKSILSDKHIDQAPGTGGASSTSGLVTKRARI